MPTPNDWQTVEHPAITDWQNVAHQQRASSPNNSGKVVEVPGVGNVEFPGSMTDDQIVAAIKRQQAPAQTQYQQITDLMDTMVRNGEMTRAEQLQAHAGLAAKGYGPGVPAPPLPDGLAATPTAQQPSARPGIRTSNPRLRALEDAHPTQLPVVDLSNNPFTRIMDGAAQIAQPGVDNKLGGASAVIRGAGDIATPYLAPLALANPVGAAVGIGGGLLGQYAATQAGHAMNLSPGAQSLLEDFGGVAGGAVGGRIAEPAVKGLLSGVGTGAKALLGATSGRGAAGLEAATRGTPEFIQAMRGNTGEEGAAAALTAARDALKARTSAQYRSDLAALPSAPLPLAARVPTTIGNALQGHLARFNVRMAPNGDLDFSRSTIADPAAQNEVKGITKDVLSWGNHPSDFTPQGLDTLKRRIGDSYSETSPARAITAGMGKTVSQVLSDHVPGYNQMQANYAKGIGLVNDVNSEMGVDAANPGVPIRKIVATSNQPNGTSSAYRAGLLSRLDDVAGSNVGDTIAGMGFRNWAPSRMATSIPVAGGVTAAYLGHPLGAGLAGLGLLSESPRLVGEGAAALGRFNRAVPALPYRAPWRTGVAAGLLSLPASQQ